MGEGAVKWIDRSETVCSGARCTYNAMQTCAGIALIRGYSYLSCVPSASVPRVERLSVGKRYKGENKCAYLHEETERVVD